jgi:hypothetical protein
LPMLIVYIGSLWHSQAILFGLLRDGLCALMMHRARPRVLRRVQVALKAILSVPTSAPSEPGSSRLAQFNGEFQSCPKVTHSVQGWCLPRALRCYFHRRCHWAEPQWKTPSSPPSELRLTKSSPNQSTSS